MEDEREHEARELLAHIELRRPVSLRCQRERAYALEQRADSHAADPGHP